MKKQLLLPAAAVAVAGAAFWVSAVDYDLSSLGTTSREDRYVSSLTLSDDQGSEAVTISDIQTAGTRNIYVDKSDQTFTTKPGAVVTITPGGAGSWMHSYAYIDWAGDGFSYTTPSDFMDIDESVEPANQYKLKAGVDLVAFTRWCPTSGETYWYNTDGFVGQNTGNNIHNWDITTPFSFTIPADAKPGTYRMRYKCAWNQLDPNGVPDIQLNNTLANDGGCIADFTLVIEGEKEPEEVNYDLSSLGSQNGNNVGARWLSYVNLSAEGSETLKIGPAGGTDEPDINKRYAIYHDFSDQVFGVNAGKTINVEVEGGGNLLQTYIYVDWGKDGFKYSQPSDLIDMETYVPLPGSDLVAHSGWSVSGSTSGTPWYDSKGNTVASPLYPTWPQTYEIAIPEGTEPGLYRARVKCAYCALDPNGGKDDVTGATNTIQNNIGTIVDFTIEVKEAPKTVDYDLSSLGQQDGNNAGARWLSYVTLSAAGSETVKFGPIGGSDQTDNMTKYAVYHDLSADKFAVEAGKTVTVEVDGGGNLLQTYVYVDWGKDGFNYTQPSDYVDVETSVPHEGSDLIAHTGWSKNGTSGPWYDSNGEEAVNAKNPSYPQTFEIAIPEGTEPGLYRGRVKTAFCSLDPNGGIDTGGAPNTIQKMIGTIVDFTIEVKDVVEEEKTVLAYNVFAGDLKWTVSDFCCDEPDREGSNGTIDKMIDNDLNTYYHSNWGIAEYKGVHFFVIDLKNSQDLYGLAYAPRPTSWHNGEWRNVSVFASDDESAFNFTEQVADYAVSMDKHQELSDLVSAYAEEHAAEGRECKFTTTGDPENVMFETPLHGRYVLVVMKESHSGHNVVAELGFYMDKQVYDELLKQSKVQAKVAQLDRYKGNVPGAEAIISDAAAQISALGTENFDEEADAILAATRTALQESLNGLATSGRLVVIKNVRRASMGQNAFLAAAGDSINTVAAAGANTDAYWTVEASGDNFVLRNYGRNAYACLGEGDQYFTLGESADYVVNAPFTFVLKDNGTVAMQLASGNTYNIDTREHGLTHYLSSDAGEEWSVVYAADQAETVLVRNVLAKNLKWTISDFCCEESSNEKPYGTIEYMIDNDLSSYYHSEWANTQYKGVHFFVIDLKTSQDLYGIAYNPRPTSWHNGEWRDVSVFASDDESAFKFTEQVADYVVGKHEEVSNLVSAYATEHAAEGRDCKFTTTGEAENVKFDIPLHGRYVLVVVKESSSGHNVVAELGFYYTKEAFDELLNSQYEPEAVDMVVTPEGGNLDSDLSSINFYIADAEYGINAEVTEPVTLSKGEEVLVSLDNEALAQHYSEKGQMYYIDCNITENGTYTLTIPEAKFIGDEVYNKETVVVWTIDRVGIESVTVNGEEVEIYDLQGRRVEKAEKGIYIINGKKVLVK